MRFEELTIERYGAFDARTLSLQDQPGLVVIYGLNEAGKSTWLSAIADFLYGVPQNSPHGQIFGNDQIRLGARLVLTNGKSLTLRRRKGRGTTLTSLDSKPVDESVLLSVLGPTSKERFTTLFGLGHKDLRSGGERLMQADGDIGRLVVEAGGGLRTLLAAIDKLGADADKLFAPRRAADRAFYQCRDNFDEADKSFKEQLKTREAYEQLQKLVSAAEQDYRELKENRRQLAEQISREQRVERVVPLLLSLDRVEEEIKSSTDLPSLPADFAATVRQSIAARDAARAAFEEAQDRWSDLREQMDAIILPDALLSAEPKIRDIHERAVHVGNERKSRPNRLTDLASDEAKLASLRERIGMPPETDLAPLLPSKITIERVQQRISKGLELRPRVESLKEEIERDKQALHALEERQAKRREAKVDAPLGVATSDLAGLPRAAEVLRMRADDVKRVTDDVAARLDRIGFSSLEELQKLPCPDAAVIQAELDRQVTYEAELTKQIGNIAMQIAAREAALASIVRLRQAGEVPTDAAIAAARAERQSAWVPIRNTFLGADPVGFSSTPVEERHKGVLAFERCTTEADQLSDRKSVEAQRITDLAAAQKAAGDANAVIGAAAVAKEEMERNLAKARFEFGQAWPDALQIAGGLHELKALVIERAEILKRHEEAEKAHHELGELRAGHDAQMDLLASTEQRIAINNAGKTLAVRVQAATSGIKSHEEAHDAFRFDLKAEEAIAERLGGRRESLAELEREHATWLTDYNAALRDVLLKEDTPPEIAVTVVTEWAAASGVLQAIKATRKRLTQFEDDEQALAELIADLAPMLNFELPADLIAAARMLDDRLSEAQKAQTRKLALDPQLLQRDRDHESKERLLKASEATLAALCQTAGADEASLQGVANRHEASITAKTEREQVMRSLTSAGDGRPIPALREEWGGRDLDQVRANISQIHTDVDQMDTDIEAAITSLKDRRHDLEPFEAEASVNTAVGQRESAAAEMHGIISRYMDLTLARALLQNAVNRVRNETQDPLLRRAGELFACVTRGSFSGIGTDIDAKGAPVVIGRRPSGEELTLDRMSDGTRDQLFLACRLASVLQYCESAEPLPFIADDLLVHFDDERADATLELLAKIGRTTQVLLFTHHKNVRAAITRIAGVGGAGLVDLN
jgi:uncharacterized protein YhaN